MFLNNLVSLCLFMFPGKYFRDFEIPKDFNHLWRYMLNMYQLDAFTQSCPADQDIINHYKLQQVIYLYYVSSTCFFLFLLLLVLRQRYIYVFIKMLRPIITYHKTFKIILKLLFVLYLSNSICINQIQ